MESRMNKFQIRSLNFNVKIAFKDILLFQVWFMILIPFAISELGVMRNILYLADAMNIFLLLATLRKGVQKYYKQVVILAISIILIGFSGYCLYGESFLAFMWGLRNTLRYLAFMINCISFFDKNDVINFLAKMEILLPFNFLLGAFQFFVQGKSGDFLGAMFGTLVGANGYLIAYLCMILTYVFSKYIFSRVGLLRVLIDIFMVLMLSIFAELKIMFILIAVICIVAILLSKYRLRTGGIIILSVVLLFFGMKLLAIYNPVSLSYMNSLEQLQWYFTNSYSSQGGIGRSNGFDVINQQFFNGNYLKQVIGLGLGQCDYSVIRLFSSKFYDQYGWLNYRLFFYAMTYLEMGVLGLCAYAMFVGRVFIEACKIKDYLFPWISYMCRFNAVIVVIMAIYNFTLRSEPGYIWAFLLAIPLIWKKQMALNED